MLRNMVTDLIKHERIRTTVPKAKVVSSSPAILTRRHAQRTSASTRTRTVSLNPTSPYVQLKRLADKMVTLGKKATLNARRECVSILRTKESLYKVFDVLGPRYEGRHGGPPPHHPPLRRALSTTRRGGAVRVSLQIQRGVADPPHRCRGREELVTSRTGVLT